MDLKSCFIGCVVLGPTVVVAVLVLFCGALTVLCTSVNVHNQSNGPGEKKINNWCLYDQPAL